MGCNCGKKNASASPAARRAAAAASQGAAASRVPVKRQVKTRQRATSAARQRPTREAPRPANSLVYYVIGPDGFEETYRTLAEAQTVVRRFGHGNGYRVESRRETS